jgi:hypothetical protein
MLSRDLLSKLSDCLFIRKNMVKMYVLAGTGPKVVSFDMTSVPVKGEARRFLKNSARPVPCTTLSNFWQVGTQLAKGKEVHKSCKF